VRRDLDHTVAAQHLPIDPTSQSIRVIGSKGGGAAKGVLMWGGWPPPAQRSPLLPEVPTFTESGMPGIDFSAWFGVFAPAGTPPAVLDQLNRQIVAAVQSPETRAKLVDAGFSVSGTSRADTEKMLETEATRWAAVVKATGFKGD
jgi:hypothetical protein